MASASATLTPPATSFWKDVARPRRSWAYSESKLSRASPSSFAESSASRTCASGCTVSVRYRRKLSRCAVPSELSKSAGGGPCGRHPYQALSAAFVRTAPLGTHADGNGLYLFVQPSGTGSWIQRLVIRGRRRELGLGSVALVSLAEAREKARANRKLAREGRDPLAEKRRTKGVPSFAEAAETVVEQQRAGWRDPKYPKVWLRSLKRYAFPRIGKMPVSIRELQEILDRERPFLSPPSVRRRQRLPASATFNIDTNCVSLNRLLLTGISSQGRRAKLSAVPVRASGAAPKLERMPRPPLADTIASLLSDPLLK